MEAASSNSIIFIFIFQWSDVMMQRAISGGGGGHHRKVRSWGGGETSPRPSL